MENYVIYFCFITCGGRVWSGGSGELRREHADDENDDDDDIAAPPKPKISLIRIFITLFLLLLCCLWSARFGPSTSTKLEKFHLQ